MPMDEHRARIVDADAINAIALKTRAFLSERMAARATASRLKLTGQTLSAALTSSLWGR
jgi:hypothetical protein